MKERSKDTENKDKVVVEVELQEQQIAGQGDTDNRDEQNQSQPLSESLGDINSDRKQPHGVQGQEEEEEEEEEEEDEEEDAEEEDPEEEETKSDVMPNTSRNRQDTVPSYSGQTNQHLIYIPLSSPPISNGPLLQDSSNRANAATSFTGTQAQTAPIISTLTFTKPKEFDFELHGRETQLTALANKILARKSNRDTIIYAAMWVVDVIFCIIIAIRAFKRIKISEHEVSKYFTYGLAAFWVISAFIAGLNFSKESDNKTYRTKKCEVIRVWGSRQVRTGIFTASTLVLGVLDATQLLFGVVAGVIGGELALFILFWKCKNYTQHGKDIISQYKACADKVIDEKVKRVSSAYQAGLRTQLQQQKNAGIQVLELICDDLYGNCSSIDDYCKTVELREFTKKVKGTLIDQFVGEGQIPHAYTVLSHPLKEYEKRMKEGNKTNKFSGVGNNVPTASSSRIDEQYEVDGEAMQRLIGSN